MKIAHTYVQWEAALARGRGGKRKVRRDVVLTKRENGTLDFHYVGWKNSENLLMVTLTPDDTYTLTLDIAPMRWYPTYCNIFRVILGVNVWSDMGRYKRYGTSLRVGLSESRWVHNPETSKWDRASSMPYVVGLKFRNNRCINPEIAVDFKRTLNREKSLPWLRKTVTLATVLRVAVRLGVLERDTSIRPNFEDVNLDDSTAKDAEIILSRGGAAGIYKLHSKHQLDIEQRQSILKRCAENGLVDFREWLYEKHGCYEMQQVQTTNQLPLP